MHLELDDEELSDVREALRLQLMGLVKELAGSKRSRVEHLRARFARVEELFRRLDRAPESGEIAAPY